MTGAFALPEPTPEEWRAMLARAGDCPYACEAAGGCTREPCPLLEES